MIKFWWWDCLSSVLYSARFYGFVFVCIGGWIIFNENNFSSIFPQLITISSWYIVFPALHCWRKFNGKNSIFSQNKMWRMENSLFFCWKIIENVWIVFGVDIIMGLAVCRDLRKATLTRWVLYYEENRKQKNYRNLLLKSIFHFHWCLMYITKIFA